MSDSEESERIFGQVPSALAIQCIPMGIADRNKTWAIVDEAIQAIDRSGLSYTVGPFETVVEGPLDRLLEVAAFAHKAVLEAGAPSVATYIKLWSGEGIGTSAEKTEKYRSL
jgi:uncharacterized protein YqgV (UPF0045/DUF77 family)